MNALAERAGILDVPEIEDPKSEPPIARFLRDLVCSQHEINPDELLRDRFLCRGGGLLVCGPTGIGKSSWAMQCKILWALGRECFGIMPARPLKSLLIQAENDDGDLAEMRDGVIAGLALSREEAKTACENIIVAREDERTGATFFLEGVRPLLATDTPDILWIDPVLAYLGGNASAQEEVSKFLRNHLNPLLRGFNCGCVVVHHANKPLSGNEKTKWQGGDFAYLGTGSAEWGNWARAVLVLRPIGSHDIFELRASKRGSRLGWRKADGQTKTNVKHLAHAKEPGVICWREAGVTETEIGGRPKSFDAEEILDLLPPEGLSAGEWQQAALKQCGVKETTFHRHRRKLELQGRAVKSKGSMGKWQPTLKP